MGLDTLFAELTTTRLALPVDDAALIPADDARLEESKTYRWNGARMSADVGLALPIVYGRHILAPNLINVFVESGEHDTLNMLLAVCEGEIDSISNIKVAGNPIENYYGTSVNDPYGKNAEITVKKGTLTQNMIQNFGDVHSLVSVNQTLSRNVPLVYLMTKTDAEAFNVEFQMDKMYQVDASENETSWYAAIRIRYRLAGAGTWENYGVMEMRKNTRSPFKRVFKSEYLPPGQYQIELTKVSEEAGSRKFGTVRVLSIDEVTTQDLTYPGTALLGIRLMASEKLSGGLPNVTCIVTGRKTRVPDVRDGLDNPVAWEDYYWDAGASKFKLIGTDSVCSWDGNTYVTDFCANPAWCLRDLLLDERGGLGQYISDTDLDEASFLAAAKYCDEGVNDLNGNAEKRMRLDMVIDAKEPALDVLYRICSTFRGLLNVSSGKVRLTVEKASDPVQMFNMGNIIRNSFVLKYLSKKTVPNVLQLTYTNKDRGYTRTTVEVADESAIAAGDELRDKSVQFIGCTRLSQAMREGKIILNKMKLNRSMISFEAAWDAVTSQPGDVIKFQHDVPAWGEGGRVQYGSTASKIILDKSVILAPATTYEIAVRDNDTDTVETRVVSTGSGTHTELDVSSPFSFTPSEYNLWSFGVQNLVTKQYRITSLTRRNDGIVDISAVEYNANAYDYSGVVAPEDDYTFLSLEIPDVSNLIATEQVTRLGDGTIDDVVNISWTKPPTGSRWTKKVVRFEVYFSDNDGVSWTFEGDTDKDFYTVTRPFVVGTTYTFAVVSVTEEEEKKVPANSPSYSVIIEGWEQAPANVEGLAYDFTEGIEFTWDKNPDENLFGYEIRTNDLNWGADDSFLVWRGQAERFYLEHPAEREGIVYYIRAFNTSNVYSSQADNITPINPAPLAVSLAYSLMFQKAMLLWDDSTDLDLVEYEIWKNDSPDWTEEETETEKLYTKAQGTSAIVLIPHDPTYYRVRAVDKYGPGEWSNYVKVTPVLLNSADVGVGAIQEVHIGDNSITSPKIVAGSILAGHIGAAAVTAEKMNVGQLSAISADLGCMTAGIIVGACIKTAEGNKRTEMNSSGVYGYDTCGRMTFKLEAGELCLIDPESYCCCGYSYLDHGALKFHHRWGEVPYVKQLCAGVACAGSTVCLCGWYEEPNIMVGIRSMTAYDCTHCTSSQEWCVYHSDVRQFGDPDVSSNFGWEFDVHAKLSVSGGTSAECIYLCNFDQCVSTSPCVCEVLVKESLQLACHACAPSTWRYGYLCFEVRYRAVGCGVWCARCYRYAQPHGTISQMLASNIACQTIGANYLTPSCNWQISVHQNGLSWRNSNINSGSYVCCLCCFNYNVDESYWASGTLTVADKSVYLSSYRVRTQESNGQWCCCTKSCTISFPSFNCAVCCSCIRYDICGCIEWALPKLTYASQDPMTLRTYPGSPDYVYPGWAAGMGASVVGCFGYSWAKSGNRPSLPREGSQAFSMYAHKSQSSKVSSLQFEFNHAIRMSCDWNNFTGCLDFQCVCVSNISQQLCFWCCNIVQCTCCCYYCVWEGDAYCCNYKKLFSLTETTEAGEILDANGLVSFLAVAYA